MHFPRILPRVLAARCSVPLTAIIAARCQQEAHFDWAFFIANYPCFFNGNCGVGVSRNIISNIYISTQDIVHRLHLRQTMSTSILNFIHNLKHSLNLIQSTLTNHIFNSPNKHYFIIISAQQTPGLQTTTGWRIAEHCSTDQRIGHHRKCVPSTRLQFPNQCSHHSSADPDHDSISNYYVMVAQDTSNPAFKCSL